jgi:hydroxymethylpyrimidine pyrophosphatase-like HAD family hydrolase
MSRPRIHGFAFQRQDTEDAFTIGGMRYLALALDYDGTIASDGVVANETIAALKRVRTSGRRVILNTGRQLDDLGRVFPHVDALDLVVAENGAIVFDPSTGHIDVRGTPPPPAFLAMLHARDVPVSIGRVIVATERRYEAVVRDAMREHGEALHVVLNKGSLMILPAGVDKGSGLLAALAMLRVSPEQTVGIGDAENDEPFLRVCGCSVVVANALPELKERVDRVTTSAYGDGVIEAIDWLVNSDVRVRSGP